MFGDILNFYNNKYLTELVARLFSVHQTSSWGQMIGFVHAEDHYWSGTEFSTVSLNFIG
jgi:hypothetical protein